MSKLPGDDSDGILMPILVSLLVVVGIGTAGLFGYIGIRLTANPLEEVPVSSVTQPHEQPQISGVRVPPENNDAEGQTQVSDKPDDVQADSAEPSALETPATVPEEENKPQTTQSPEKQPETKSTQPSGRTIYITPTGKRYHYDGNCNGGTYIESTLDEANRLGLTPCNKCVN